MKLTLFTYYTLISIITISCFSIIDKNDFGYYGLSIGLIGFIIYLIFRCVRAIKKSKGYLEITEYIGLILVGIVFLCKAYIVLFLGINTVYIIGLSIVFIVTLLRVKEILSIRGTLDKKVFTTHLILMVALLLYIDVTLIYLFFEKTYYIILLIATAISVGTLLYIALVNIISYLRTKSITTFIQSDTFRGFWLLLGFILLSSYQLVTHYKITDEYEFRRLPSEYVDLFYQAEFGDEEPVDGKYKYEIFMEGYNKYFEDFGDF